MTALVVGQRVRMTAHALACFPRDRSCTGTVKSVFKSGNTDMLRIIRDGYSARRAQTFHPHYWEPIPDGELTTDHTAICLAVSVLRGETDAAMLLADRVMELCGGTKS